MLRIKVKLSTFLVTSVVILFGLVGVGFWELKETVSSQLTNRVTNVTHWCGGINESRDYDRNFVDALSKKRIYLLNDLDCNALEKKTRSSGETTSPLVELLNNL